MAVTEDLHANSPAPERLGSLLIVDDDLGVLDSLQMTFKGEYELFLANDMPTAIKLAEENEIDVVLLDIRLGVGVSGVDVLERLKFLKPDIEAVMMTGQAPADTVLQSLRLGACEYIYKPYDLQTMRAAVSKAMQRRTLGNGHAGNGEKVQQLVAELHNQRIAEQIAQTRSDIFASIIHDINNPLAVINGYVQLLDERISRAEQLAGEELEFIKKRMSAVLRQTRNCVAISQRYLDLLRNRSATDAPPVSVSHLLEDLDPLVRIHPSVNGNEFSVTPFGEDVAVKGDGTDLMQILKNLAVNAFQCSPQHKRVEICGEVLRAPLDLASLKEGPNDRLINVESMDNTAPLVKIQVRDTGPGIPVEVLPKIFRPYFTTKGSRGGTGLGLSIIQLLVKKGNGALHCHTQPGKGTTFTVYLPGAGLAN
ncbi:MAG TPA: hybrid sensor histidine kinase/response regulator [Candidatus Paceibacterota bacterium]|nr:hybrid sensor histidine kinase/response regulator [Verrucomicrobiota bacterium]HSA10518.1 hybrid sensor histidine kinase/response regulator [Candidatus Paceibacterota bacterium]